MDTLVAALKALADETRMGIVRELLSHDLCVRALAARLGLSEAAVSQHLQVLRKAGLVRGEKRGYWTHYEVDREALGRAAGDILGLARLEADPGGPAKNGTSCEGKEGEDDVR